MNVKFDSYEFIGDITPGAVSLSGLLYIFPELKGYLQNTSGSLGNLGIFIIFAYVAGQLISAVGNFLESFWWIRRGKPTGWVLNDNQKMLFPQQREELFRRVHHMCPESNFLKGGSKKKWFPITREMYAKLCQAKATERIDIFNRNYGLMRGLAASFLCFCVFYTLGSTNFDYKIFFFILCCAGISLYRMNRFAKLYALELFVQFLALPFETAFDSHKSSSNEDAA